MPLFLECFALIFTALFATCETAHLEFELTRRPGSGLDRRRTESVSRDRSGRGLFRGGGLTHKENDGVYFTTLRIGKKNPQSFSVIVDTGSGTIAVPCKGALRATLSRAPLLCCNAREGAYVVRVSVCARPSRMQMWRPPSRVRFKFIRHGR